MTNAQTEARVLLETAGARFPEREDYDAAVAVIATALAAKDAARDEAIFLKDCAEAALVKRESELVAKNAELAAAKAQLIAAWNAFGPSSSRTGKTAFDADDLEHLPRSADGGLDEQIRCLEDRAERAEAQLAEKNKALEPFAAWITAVENAPNVIFGGDAAIVADPDGANIRLTPEHFRAARRAREQGDQNAE